MGIMDCPACGQPRPFNFLIEWGRNGTITSRIRPAFRVVLVESALLEDIYQRIEEALGMSIRGIVFEAERAASTATIDSMVPDWMIRWLLRNRVAMHPASRLMQSLARLAGLADARTIYYHPFRGSLARVRNAYSRDLFAAMVVGAFERMEGLVHEHRWIESGGELFLFIMPAREKPEIAGRMKPQIVDLLPGDRRLDHCRRCGSPTALAHLRWDMPDARITDERRGVRMSFVDAYAFSSVFRELVMELGEDIMPIIVEAAAEYTLRSMEETGFFDASRGREEMYDEFLDLLPVYGQGNPVMREISKGSLEVTIENPYSAQLLSGQLVAAFERIEGSTGSVYIDDSDPHRLKLSIKG